jgi:hypothetical protein
VRVRAVATAVAAAAKSKREGTTALPPRRDQAAFFLFAAANQLASPNGLTIPATAAIAVSVSSVFSNSISRSVTVSTVSDGLLASRSEYYRRGWL